MSDEWFTENFFHQSVGTQFKIKEVLHREKSPYQTIEVLDTWPLGKLLLLDGKTMISDLDEFVYHEVITHIPMMVLERVARVLIIGGGDGGAVREFAKYPEITEIVLCEIDRRVVEVSQKYFPHCTSALTDPRVQVRYQDGVEYIRQQKNYFDIIIIDSTDPQDFAQGLFTSEFYQLVFQALTSQGIMMAQTENIFYDEWDIGKIYNNLRQAFPIVESFPAPIPIYPGTYWSFAFASKCQHGNQIVSGKIPLMEKLQLDLRWYNLPWHRGAYHLSNLHKKITGITHQ